MQKAISYQPSRPINRRRLVFIYLECTTLCEFSSSGHIRFSVHIKADRKKLLAVRADAHVKNLKKIKYIKILFYLLSFNVVTVTSICVSK